MKEIYFVLQSFSQAWINVFSFALSLLAFMLFFVFPLVWLFYLLSEKKGKKFRSFSVQLFIFLGTAALALIMGLGISFQRSYGDFNKLQTDGKTYIATHTIKFWKKKTFDISQVDTAYVKEEYFRNLKNRGLIIRILFKDGEELNSDFIENYKPFISNYYNETWAHADSLLLCTGLNGNNPPVSVYPRWLDTEDLLNKLKNFALWGFISFIGISLIIFLPLFLLSGGFRRR